MNVTDRPDLSATAVLSLELAAIGLLLSFPLLLVALVVGVVAIVRIVRSGRRRRGLVPAVLGVGIAAAGMIGFVVVSSIVLPFVSRVQAVPRPNCQENTLALGKAISMYCLDYECVAPKLTGKESRLIDNALRLSKPQRHH